MMVDCERCKGRGKISGLDPNTDLPQERKCPKCDGLGLQENISEPANSPDPIPLIVKVNTDWMQVWIENVSDRTVELRRPSLPTVLLEPRCAFDITFKLDNTAKKAQSLKGVK